MYNISTDPEEKEMVESSEFPQRLRTFYSLSFCNRIIALLLNVLVIYWVFGYRGGVFLAVFNWHPLLMVFGMVYLHSRGMLFYRTERTIGMSRLRLMYARLIIIAVVLIVTGLVAGSETNDLRSARFLETDPITSESYSMHSYIGLTSVVLFFSQCIADLFTCLCPAVNQLTQFTYYAKCKVYLTAATFIGAVTSCLLGFKEMADFYTNQAWESTDSENMLIWSIYLSLIVFGGFTLYLYSNDSYKRLKRPEDEAPLTKTLIFKHLCCIPWSFSECTYSLRMLFSKTHSSPVLTTVDIR